MKIITSNLYLFFVLSAVIFGNLIISQTILAHDNLLDSKSVYSANANHQIQYVNTFTGSSPSSPLPSSSSTTEMSDVLTASFTNIIDTQIYTGLDQLSN